jgi:hypothetical protein
MAGASAARTDEAKDPGMRSYWARMIRLSTSGHFLRVRLAGHHSKRSPVHTLAPVESSYLLFDPSTESLHFRAALAFLYTDKVIGATRMQSELKGF